MEDFDAAENPKRSDSITLSTSIEKTAMGSFEIGMDFTGKARYEFIVLVKKLLHFALSFSCLICSFFVLGGKAPVLISSTERYA